MLWIESVNGIPIGMKTLTENYNETIERTNKVIRSMSDWMVRSGDIYQNMCDKWLDKRPVCAYCDEHISDETALYLNGEWICNDCVSRFTENVDDYLEDGQC